MAILSEHFGIGIDCVDVKTNHIFSYGKNPSPPLFFPLELFPNSFAHSVFNFFARSIPNSFLRVVGLTNVGESYPTRCILLYSGIHYDAISYTYLPAIPEADVTIYEISPTSELQYSNVIAGAREMASKLKERGYHVDTATFNIVCEECGRGFKGEREAVKHAGETGHTAFGQIPAEEEG